MAPPTAQIDIELQDGSALKSFCLKATGWEDLGWISSPSGHILQYLIGHLRQRKERVSFLLWSTSRQTKRAHNLALQASTTPSESNLQLEAPTHTSLRGAKLSEMTQKTAKDRKQTVENLKLIQSSSKANFGTLPTNGNLSRKARNFFWKSIHGAHRIGKYWKNIPTMEDHAKCSHCGDTESLQHILIECERPGPKTLWEKKSLPWHEPSLGGVLGAGLAVFRDANGKELKGSSRLYKILLSESVFLIWKIRCEVVIQDDGVPKHEAKIHNRWLAIINERLEMDKSLTNRRRFGKIHSIHPRLVLDTWRDTLADETQLPDDWIRQDGVLVGMAPMRSLGSPSLDEAG
ncbi:hypothetical protein C8F01DRAFT_1222526 [Mycena amicta]|nr:hypothetical protein C8F01DRAFT_1222526 [Mycena amicta]